MAFFLQLIKDRILTVIVFSGYTLEELRSWGNSETYTALGLTDVLIAGEFRQEENNGIGLRGSSNQSIHFLSGIYQEQKKVFLHGRRRVDVVVSSHLIRYIGVPPKEGMECMCKH